MIKSETFPFVASVHFDWVSLNLDQCNLDHTANQSKVTKLQGANHELK